MLEFMALLLLFRDIVLSLSPLLTTTYILGDDLTSSLDYLSAKL